MTLSAQKIANRGNAIATFNSLAGAKNFIFKLTKDSTLCPKLNGISEAKKNCSNYDSGECKGACIEKENVQEYNQRVEVAIQQYSLNGKNEIIVDKGREIGEYCAILIKNGLFKGFGYYDLNHQINNIHILESIIVPMNGDQNTTHIIESYLRKRRVLKVLELSN